MDATGRKRALIYGLSGLLLVLTITLCAGVADAASEGGSGRVITAWDTLKASGICGLIIILLSVAGVALVITFFIHVRRDEFVPPDLLDHLSELFENESYDEALEVCENNPSWLSTVMVAGLRRIDAGYEEIEKSMREASIEESEKLYQRVGYLNLIAQVAPMLGLLGTVQGMIIAFNVIASAETQPKPSQLAYGISMALVTTFEGLVVAIPILSFYSYFRNQVAKAEMEIGTITEEMMDRFRKQ